MSQTEKCCKFQLTNSALQTILIYEQFAFSTQFTKATKSITFQVPSLFISLAHPFSITLQLAANTQLARALISNTS